MNREEFEATTKDVLNRYAEAMALLQGIEDIDALNALVVIAYRNARRDPKQVIASSIVDAFIKVTVDHPLDTDAAIKSLRMAGVLEQHMFAIRETSTYDNFIASQENANV